MKIQLLLLVFIVSLSSAFAQQELYCGTDKVMENRYVQVPELKKRLQNKGNQYLQIRALNPNGRNRSVNYIIPIVFHVMHTGGPENISDAQVRDGLAILNRDFALQNPDLSEVIPDFQGIADSTGIRFELATKDPAGNCTNGIIHHFDTDADWNENSPTVFSLTWDPTKYLNVYLVKSITLGSGFGAAGYTYRPGSWPDGDPHDAIVVLNNYFASTGTGTPFLSRVLTHELGHWLGLPHVFGEQGAGLDCTGDDQVIDTPPTAGFVYCPDSNDPSTYQLCTPGVSENFQNYMDYSYCVKMFTAGQCDRMEQVLNDVVAGRSNLWTTANLQATGVVNPMSCAPVADFKSDRQTVCVNSPVYFSDASWQGIPTTYTWTFAGGTPSSSSDPNPVVTYSLPGTYSVSLITANPAGTSSPTVATGFITVTSGLADLSGEQKVDFEGLSTLPNGWILSNSSGGVNWQLTGLAGFNSTGSIMVPSVGNTRYSKTRLTSPVYDLNSLLGPRLNFVRCGAELNPQHINRFTIWYTANCGESWNVLKGWSGQELVTTSTGSSDFYPTKSNEWVLEELELDTMANKSAVQFMFEYERDSLSGPVNFFLDDIALVPLLSNTVLGLTSLSISPNPVTSLLQMPTETIGRHYSIVSLAGQLVVNGAVTAVLDLTVLPSGIYLMEVYHENGVLLRQKLVKK